MWCELRKLSAIDASYFAGIVDGEGTITLVRWHRGENRRPVISISNNELPLLQHVQLVIGSGRITNKRAASAHHAPSFTYVISGHRAIALMKQLAPYLRTYKGMRARLIVERYLKVTPRNGRYSPQMRAARQAFETEFFSLRVRALRESRP
jgi:hypothetical protein